MKMTSLIEVCAPGKTKPLSQLINRAFTILNQGRLLDELSDFNDAGLLYEMATRIEIRVSGVVESNTFWTRVVLGQSLEECAKKGDRSIECLCHTVKEHTLRGSHAERVRPSFLGFYRSNGVSRHWKHVPQSPR